MLPRSPPPIELGSTQSDVGYLAKVEGGENNPETSVRGLW